MLNRIRHMIATEPMIMAATNKVDIFEGLTGMHQPSDEYL
jgi:hypothetical protein